MTKSIFTISLAIESVVRAADSVDLESGFAKSCSFKPMVGTGTSFVPVLSASNGAAFVGVLSILNRALFVSAVLLIASRASAVTPRLCADLFAEGASALNPTAGLSAREYQLPNDRKWRDYIRVLFKSPSEARDFLRDGDLVIDLGGGQGRAMYDVTQSRPINTLVVNTQDFSGTYDVRSEEALRDRSAAPIRADSASSLIAGTSSSTSSLLADSRSPRPAPRTGRLAYRTGFAEDVLPTLAANSAGGVFDVFGAFHYSVHKDLLIEEIYRVLKPGASALLLFDFSNAPAFVGGQRFDQWLVQKAQGVFSVRSTEINGRRVCILKVTKLADATSALELGLEIESADINPRLPVVPRVKFRTK